MCAGQYAYIFLNFIAELNTELKVTWETSISLTCVDGMTVTWFFIVTVHITCFGPKQPEMTDFPTFFRVRRNLKLKKVCIAQK